jgi:hypothetical protein
MAAQGVSIGSYLAGCGAEFDFSFTSDAFFRSHTPHASKYLTLCNKK